MLYVWNKTVWSTMKRYFVEIDQNMMWKWQLHSNVCLTTNILMQVLLFCSHPHCKHIFHEHHFHDNLAKYMNNIVINLLIPSPQMKTKATKDHRFKIGLLHWLSIPLDSPKQTNHNKTCISRINDCTVNVLLEWVMKRFISKLASIYQSGSPRLNTLWSKLDYNNRLLI